MSILKSKVYVQTNDKNCVIRCEGGYTAPTDLDDWIQIDEGIGDRYNLCQSHYFPEGLYTEDGIPKYKLVENFSWLPMGSRVIIRLQADIEADRAALPKPEKQPTVKELEAKLNAAIEKNKMLEECLVEMAGIIYA